MVEIQRQVVEAEVVVDPGGDPAAPGAAVTAALCGHWEHDGPCRWPHRNELDGTRFRTEFHAPDAEVDEVRQRIEAALEAGALDGTHWTVLSR